MTKSAKAKRDEVIRNSARKWRCVWCNKIMGHHGKWCKRPQWYKNLEAKFL